MLARTSIDMLVVLLVMPISGFLFRNLFLPEDAWHPFALFVTLGVMRSCAPYAASFQGSRVGRVLTRNFFQSYKNRWRPVQRVKNLNLFSDDCCEKDEISQTADLAKLCRIVASALGKAQLIGLDGIEGQKEALSREGFRQIGAGSGGYAVFECHRRVFSRKFREDGEFMTLLLHVTPYGPSILDVMPRYVVLEFEDSVDRRNHWSTFNSDPPWEGPSLVEGYCYNGAFFSPHHFSELKDMYDKQLSTYNDACRAMCKPRSGRILNPPSDLSSLKAFLLEGKRPRTRKKNKREYIQLHSKMLQLSNEIKKLLSNKDGCCAPSGVILYFEGLDCSGKSSTGGLLEEALRDAGYDVSTRQYNKPPTREQKMRPWMDRFETPGGTFIVTITKNGTENERKEKERLLNRCEDHHHAALVWDRGPAGDFVYNPEYREMEQVERNEKYREFVAFERDCFDKNILFVKVLFVTNRDSIAATLGKRLAQKKMAHDLRTWLSSSRGDVSKQGVMGFEGLDAIEQHIDPTDFLAFNNYQTNLRIFTNFAWNTDTSENPWIVVNTGDRYTARKHLLHAFQVKVDYYQKRKKELLNCSEPRLVDVEGPASTPPGLDEEAMLQQGLYRPCSIQFMVTLIGITMIVWYYCKNTTFGEFKATLFGDGD
jgi:polyphosphate kinase 2 (PPK2 family)